MLSPKSLKKKHDCGPLTFDDTQMFRLKHDKLVALKINTKHMSLDKNWLSGFPSIKRLDIIIREKDWNDETFTFPDVSVVVDTLEWLSLEKSEIKTSG